jgi:hypothetical protein
LGAYPTNIGDLSKPKAESYSQIVVSVPVTRPVVAMALKTFVPIALIVVCAALVFFMRPRYVEGRIGHHGPSHPCRAAAHLDLRPSGRRLSDDAR